jgi:hypothetical protein
MENLKSKTLFKVSLQTRKFEFEVYGENEDEIIKILEKGVRKHCKQYEVSVDEFWKEYKRDTQITQIQLNKAYRDLEEI